MQTNIENTRQIKCCGCGAFCAQPIQTYRNTWNLCLDCGSTTRQLRVEKMQPSPNKFLKKVLPPAIYFDLIDKESSFVSDSEHYRLYDEVSSLPLEKTKWKHLPQKFMQIFKRLDFDILQARILDISGGPGFLTQFLGQHSRQATVTEFDSVAVETMKRNLHIDARVYDYNKDDIRDVAKGEKFDFIIIENSINYCKNLRQLALQLKEVLTPDGMVYISYTTPSLGPCLRWQFDPYVFMALFTEKSITQAFEKAGYRTRDKWLDANFFFLANLPRKYWLYHLPISLIYWLGAQGKRRWNKSLFQRGSAIVFQNTNG